VSSRKLPLIEVLTVRFPERDRKALYAEVLRGGVTVGGLTVVKPGIRVDPQAPLSVRDRPRYVSRGGDKLAAALDAWDMRVGDRVWIDAGCSTGGFTDCLLERGAACVYAVDVGVKQLDFRIRGDARVRVMEGTNAMAILPGQLVPQPDLVAADLSFRSLRRAAAHLLSLAKSATGIFLVKPQFEWKDPAPGFHGVVREPRAIEEILHSLVADLAAEGVALDRAIPSPLRGRKGNREFLFLLRIAQADEGTGAAAASALRDLSLE
jgi:23S rRNA (cytidine1920-2'-O)/16S rRNA (cytidine1409-2'-O)-methyltransferase